MCLPGAATSRRFERPLLHIMLTTLFRSARTTIYPPSLSFSWRSSSSLSIKIVFIFCNHKGLRVAATRTIARLPWRREQGRT